MKRWPTKPLEDLIVIQKGKKAVESFSVPTKTSIRYLQIEDLRPDTNVKYCEPFDCPRLARTDAVIAWDGANAGTVSCNLQGYIGSTLAALRPNETLSAVFLSRFLEGNFGYLQSTANGATIPHISKEALTSLQIPVPPLAEQERIVKLLDEADELRKLRVQADRRTAKLFPALFAEMFGKRNNSWRRSTLGELVQEFRYGTSNKSTADGKPTLRIPNVMEQAVNLDDLKFVPVLAADFERLRLIDGDLLFVRTNGNADYVGRCAVFDTKVIKAAGYDADEFIYASYLIRARLQTEKVSPIFVQNFLTSFEGLSALRARSKTSAGQFNINTEGLGSIPIPVPPLPLQKEFAQRVTEIRELEAGQAASRRRLEELFQSLLHRAFKGEL